MIYQYPDYLAHHGVKGMKWGVRKRVKNTVKSLSSKRTKNYSSDYKKTRTLRRKSSKELSNEQLKMLNKRMNLEQEYNRLSTQTTNRGINVARNIVSAAGTIGGLYAISKSDYVKAGSKILMKGLTSR